MILFKVSTCPRIRLLQIKSDLSEIDTNSSHAGQAKLSLFLFLVLSTLLQLADQNPSATLQYNELCARTAEACYIEIETSRYKCIDVKLFRGGTYQVRIPGRDSPPTFLLLPENKLKGLSCCTNPLDSIQSSRVFLYCLVVSLFLSCRCLCHAVVSIVPSCSRPVFLSSFLLFFLPVWSCPVFPSYIPVLSFLVSRPSSSSPILSSIVFVRRRRPSSHSILTQRSLNPNTTHVAPLGFRSLIVVYPGMQFQLTVHEISIQYPTSNLAATLIDLAEILT